MATHAHTRTHARTHVRTHACTSVIFTHTSANFLVSIIVHVNDFLVEVYALCSRMFPGYFRVLVLCALAQVDNLFYLYTNMHGILHASDCCSMQASIQGHTSSVSVTPQTLTCPLSLPLSFALSFPLSLPLSLPLSFPLSLPLSLPLSFPLSLPLSLPLRRRGCITVSVLSSLSAAHCFHRCHHHHLHRNVRQPT